ncbi:MAG: hypothetical protein A3F33_03860 [Candidatus Woykebacteria bacterium RIFCSPHIGHO2_12_FULL_43_10]|nr:MAG: hypothetical protein A3F33_03860 [Candidatus Woykebacteria bacterium RIFCSPHIGHO2_12_FULL_43_10]
MPRSGIVNPDETVLQLCVKTFTANAGEPGLAVEQVDIQIQSWLAEHSNAEDVEMYPTQSQGSESFWYTILLICYLRVKIERRPLFERFQKKRL